MKANFKDKGTFIHSVTTIPKTCLLLLVSPSHMPKIPPHPAHRCRVNPPEKGA